MSRDPIKKLAESLLGVVEAKGRVNLADTIELARARDMEDGDAIAALGRLDARGVGRYFIDRSGEAPSLVEPAQVCRAIVAHEAGDNAATEWMTAVEVVWARSAADALGGTR